MNQSLGGTAGRERNAHDPEADESVRNESGLGRFAGVLIVLMVIIGLGGGFTVRADDGREDGEDDLEDLGLGSPRIVEEDEESHGRQKKEAVKLITSIVS